jgi:hypothetical protein
MIYLSKKILTSEGYRGKILTSPETLFRVFHLEHGPEGSDFDLDWFNRCSANCIRPFAESRFLWERWASVVNLHINGCFARKYRAHCIFQGSCKFFDLHTVRGPINKSLGALCVQQIIRGTSMEVDFVKSAYWGRHVELVTCINDRNLGRDYNGKSPINVSESSVVESLGIKVCSETPSISTAFDYSCPEIKIS